MCNHDNKYGFCRALNYGLIVVSIKLVVSRLLANDIDLIHVLIFDYVIHFRMAKAHECPLAAVCSKLPSVDKVYRAT